MKLFVNSTIFLTSLILFCSLPAWSQAREIRLSAAASMTDAVRELISTYTHDNPGVTILPNFGSSGSLAKQIALGAPADLYVSANRKWMDYLVKKNKIIGDTVRIFANNALVFIGKGKNTPSALADLTGLSRIALGSPGSVPAGQYAEQAMRSAGIYETLKKGRRLVMAKDVRQALLYAERGEVDGAFVYKTDSLLVEEARVLFIVPANRHNPIAYPVGLTQEGKRDRSAVSFHTFLTGETAAAILENYGFSVSRTPVAGHN